MTDQTKAAANTPRQQTRARKAARAKLTPGERVAAQLLSGELDGELKAVSEALGERVKAGVGLVRWRVDLPDLSVTQDEITLGEAVSFERATGLTWGEMEPLGSAEHAAAILLCLYQSRNGLTEEAAEAHVDALPVDVYSRAITTYIDTDRPT